ncbi:MAG TPA: phosphatidylcholine synthase [Sphingomicrobium sp.]
MLSRLAATMIADARTSRAAAWAVHLFSASGAVLALLAMVAIRDHRWTDAMLWLFVALVVDGVDGTLARAARVKEIAPRIDGGVLDLVIDYLNYVFVPTLFILEAGLLPVVAAIPLAALIQISSLYVFARRDMKTEDNYFRGFPALWNIVALYLFAAQLDFSVAAAIVAALALLTFAPIHFVHPFRVRDYGPWLPITALVWAFSTLSLLVDSPAAARGLLLAISAISAIVIVGLGLLRTVRGPQIASNPSAVRESTSSTVRSSD